MILLILAVLIRPAAHASADLVGDDLAIVTSLAIVLAGAAYGRFARS